MKPSTKTIPPITVRSEDQLSSAIRRLRKAQGLSQVDLAKKAGVTQATISRIEQGNKESMIKTIFLILAALGVELLVSGKTQTNQSGSLEGLI